MLYNELVCKYFVFKRLLTRKSLPVILLVVLAFMLVGCNSQPTNEPLTQGKIVDIVKHDDVEVKKRVCTSYKTTRKTNTTKSKKVCASYKTVTREVRAEYYDFKLQRGNKTEWVTVDENTGESYKVNDMYP